MAVNIDNKLEPVGSMKEWIRPTNLVPIPFGWLILDGSVVADASSTFNGKTLPDKRQKFPRGHSTLTNANFPADVTYFTGGTIPAGGTDSNNFFHGHTLGGHTHGHDHAHNVNAFAGNTLALSGYSHNHNTVGGAQFNNASPLGTTSTDFHSHSATGRTDFASSSPGGSQTGGPSGGSDGALGVVDNRPAYQEFVWIIKIK